MFFLQFVQRESHFFLDYLYPRACFHCRQSLAFTPYLYLCSGCLATIKRKSTSRCLSCAQSILYIKKCAKCKGKHFPWKELFCAYEYEEALASLVRNWKFRGEETATWMAIKKLFQKALTEFEIPTIDFVVPIPSHPKKMAERGFNPAEQLAKIAAKQLAIPLGKHLLQRVCDTPNQKELSEKERQDNLRGAFSGNKSPKKILLVDDIFTTGSTLREASQVLKKNGAKSIYCLVLARTPRYF